MSRLRVAAALAVVAGVIALAAAGSSVLLHRSSTATSADGGPVTYHGSYLPLPGVRMTEAYASTVSITYDEPVWRKLCYVGGLAAALSGGGVLLLSRRRGAG